MFTYRFKGRKVDAVCLDMAVIMLGVTETPTLISVTPVFVSSHYEKLMTEKGRKLVKAAKLYAATQKRVMAKWAKIPNSPEKRLAEQHAYKIARNDDPIFWFQCAWNAWRYLTR